MDPKYYFRKLSDFTSTIGIYTKKFDQDVLLAETADPAIAQMITGMLSLISDAGGIPAGLQEPKSPADLAVRSYKLMRHIYKAYSHRLPAGVAVGLADILSEYDSIEVEPEFDKFTEQQKKYDDTIARVFKFMRRVYHFYHGSFPLADKTELNELMELIDKTPIEENLRLAYTKTQTTPRKPGKYSYQRVDLSPADQPGEPQIVYHVVHSESGEGADVHTMIAETDDAEKADFLSKAANYFDAHQHGDPEPPVELDEVCLGTASEFIDRAISMLKDEYEHEPLIAAYNGIVSLLGYAKMKIDSMERKIRDLESDRRTLFESLEYLRPHLTDLKTENAHDPSVGIFTDPKLDQAIVTIFQTLGQ